MKHLRHLFIVLLLLFVSATTMAQTRNENTEKNLTEWSTRADVNGDGVVNMQDVLAIIAIMQKAGGVSDGKTKYYWYVGQENPASMTSISPIVDDNTSPGWRLIGTSIPEYNISNKLWDGVTNGITFNARDIYYYVVPSNNIKIYDDTGASVMDVFTTSEVTIEGVKYYVYTSNSKARGIAWMVY